MSFPFGAVKASTSSHSRWFVLQSGRLVSTRAEAGGPLGEQKANYKLCRLIQKEKHKWVGNRHQVSSTTGNHILFPRGHILRMSLDEDECWWRAILLICPPTTFAEINLRLFHLRTLIVTTGNGNKNLQRMRKEVVYKKCAAVVELSFFCGKF